ncbi:hypothetical protein Ddye_011562 [Dipteronia dyeriana]|uniref:Uncharacterized protein n=1 Tax=Dipteronia dyeriana TaxID=168575 RepID=A0AAD9X2R9_9ROSI|nr:hypothetical protein Ddye_011562 [Dipteronia dyeriana]
MYVQQCLTKSAYMQTYKGMIHPLPDQKMWPEIEAGEVLPPPFEVQPGRPKMQRKRESGENTKGGRTGTIVCTYCKMPRHNKRTCKKAKKQTKQRLPSTTEASSSQAVDANPTRKNKIKKQHPSQGGGFHNPSQS